MVFFFSLTTLTYRFLFVFFIFKFSSQVQLQNVFALITIWELFGERVLRGGRKWAVISTYTYAALLWSLVINGKETANLSLRPLSSAAHCHWSQSRQDNFPWRLLLRSQKILNFFKSIPVQISNITEKVKFSINHPGAQRL